MRPLDAAERAANIWCKFDVAMHKTATKCSSIICTLKLRLVCSLKENIFPHVYVEANSDTTFPSEALKLLYFQLFKKSKKKYMILNCELLF
jgi:hypothetical protein